MKKTSCKRGIVMYLVLFVAMVLTILSLQFRKLASHARYAAFRSEEDEAIRQIAESAIDELFNKIWLQADIEGSRIQNAFVQRSRETIKFTSNDFPETKSLGKGPRAYLSPIIEGEMRILDFRQKSFQDHLYYKNESIGTLELTVKAYYDIKTDAKIPAPVCTLTRHHDFKVASVITSANRGNVYAHNHLLDYVLLVRNGLKEFRTTNGCSLNSSGVRLKIHPFDNGKIGKIFFGGTVKDGPGAGIGETPKGNYVFLNTVYSSNGSQYPNTQPLIPLPVNHPDVEVDYQVVFRLFPEFPELIRKKKEEALKKYPKEEVEDAFKEYEEQIKKLKGKFHMVDLPVVGLPDQKLEPVRNSAINLIREDLEGADKNIDPGIAILDTEGPYAFDHTPLEGDIRQRFLHLVYFEIDDSEVKLDVLPQDVRNSFHDIRKQKACVDVGNAAMALIDEPNKRFYQELKRYNQERVQNGEIPVVSSLTVDFPYKKGLTNTLKETAVASKESFPVPKFVDRSGQFVLDPILPFSHRNLYSLDLQNQGSMIATRVYRPEDGILEVRGIMRVKGDLYLGKSGKTPIKIRGQGVIVCDGRIFIYSGIEKEGSNDVLVLMSRGGLIEIHSNQRIEAGLISMTENFDGSIRPFVPMKLYGLLLVDNLDTGKWFHGDHEIFFDGAFNREEDLYKVVISRQITLQRISGSL